MPWPREQTQVDVIKACEFDDSENRSLVPSTYPLASCLPTTPKEFPREVALGLSPGAFLTWTIGSRF